MLSTGQQLGHGLGGAVAGPLRTGAPVSVGGVALPDWALHQQVSLDGAVLAGGTAPGASDQGSTPRAGAGRGSSGPPGTGRSVMGVAGAALLHRCVLQLHLPRRARGARAPPTPTATLVPVPTPTLPPPGSLLSSPDAAASAAPAAATPPVACFPASSSITSKGPGMPPAAPDSPQGSASTRTLLTQNLPGVGAQAVGEWAWQELRFIDGMPHVRARLSVTSSYDEEPLGGVDGGGGWVIKSDGSAAEGRAARAAVVTSHEGWFRLALGVGGTGIVLSGSAARDLGFAEAATPLAPHGMMAGPGEARARLAAVEEGAVLSARLDEVQLGFAGLKPYGQVATASSRGDVDGGQQDSAQSGRVAVFKQVRCLVHAPSDRGAGGDVEALLNPDLDPHHHAPSDLELSFQASGLLCADMFRGCSLCIDFPGRRLGVAVHPEEQVSKLNIWG